MLLFPGVHTTGVKIRTAHGLAVDKFFIGEGVKTNGTIFSFCWLSLNSIIIILVVIISSSVALWFLGW